jgi:hypothetical protein
VREGTNIKGKDWSYLETCRKARKYENKEGKAVDMAIGEPYFLSEMKC